jgi:hypothetical protein
MSLQDGTLSLPVGGEAMVRAASLSAVTAITRRCDYLVALALSSWPAGEQGLPQFGCRGRVCEAATGVVGEGLG